MIYKRSSALFVEAERVIPGGVNSPVRVATVLFDDENAITRIDMSEYQDRV